jgi:DNA-binding transcriptional MerR regulator
MTNLFKIGTFSLLSHLPVKTLHHYDEIGLLRPSHVDAFTGYRYYTLDQLPNVQRILALKDLGLSLDQIIEVIHDQPTVEDLCAMLRLRRAQLTAELEDMAAQLARVDARLKQLLEGDMTDYAVALKTVKPMLVASVRMTVPKNEDVPKLLGDAYCQIEEHIKQHGGKVAGPCLTVWYTPSTQYTDEDVEAAYPLAERIAEGKGVCVRELPEVLVASVVHRGNFDEFTNGHAYILKWAEANGYRIGDQYREIYVQHDPKGTSTTEIQFKVEHV